MPDEPEEVRVCDSGLILVKELIENFGCCVAEKDDLMQAIRDEERRREAAWSWIDRFSEEEAPVWVNDQDTLVIAVPLANLAGDRCLHFTQRVWALQPCLFEYAVWGGRGFVRLWWDPGHSPMRAKVRGYKRFIEGGGSAPRQPDS